MKRIHFIAAALLLMVLWAVAYSYITQGFDLVFCTGLAGAVGLTVIFWSSYKAGFRFIPDDEEGDSDDE